MPDRVLPAHPNLEQYKNQAKDLLADRAQASPETLARIRHSHPRFQHLADPDVLSASFKLSDAQCIIAREHDFASWPKFAEYVRTLQTEPSPRPTTSTQQIPVDGIELTAEITIPDSAEGLVLFTNASGSSRHHPRNRALATLLNRQSLSTVQTDLLTEEEELADLDTNQLALDLRFLDRRIAALTQWIGDQPRLQHLALGYLASGTGTAAALLAAAERPSIARAVVSIGGRPDLAGPFLHKVQAPVLLIVGGSDALATGLHRTAIQWFQQNERKLEIIQGTTQSLEEGSDAFNHCAVLACNWFGQYLGVF